VPAMLRLGAKLLGWKPVDATLIDQRFLRRDAYQSEMGGRTPYQVWEYMVELPDDQGTPLRLTIEEKTFNLGHPGPQIGDTVPVLVNRRRTRAAFDLKDPRLDWQAAADIRDKRRRAEDEARFQAKLRGGDGPEDRSGAER
jgi:hypothetical protein